MSVSDLLPTYPSPDSTLTLTCNPVDFCWIKGGAGAQLRYVRIQISRGLKPYGASFISRFLTQKIQKYFGKQPRQSSHNFLISFAQLMIPSIWTFSLILILLLFLVTSFIEGKTSCVDIWLVLITLSVMVGLYSRVIYTLWLKRDTDHRLTFQQKEELHVRVEVWHEISFPHLISKFCCVILCNAISLMRREVNDKMFTLDCKNVEFMVFR